MSEQEPDNNLDIERYIEESRLRAMDETVDPIELSNKICLWELMLDYKFSLN